MIMDCVLHPYSTTNLVLLITNALLTLSMPLTLNSQMTKLLSLQLLPSQLSLQTQLLGSK